MGKYFQFFRNILLLVVMALLFVGCSEKGAKATSELKSFTLQTTNNYNLIYAKTG